MLAALSVIGALTLIGLALFVGGLLLRRLPPTGLVLGALIVGFGLGIPAIVIDDNRAETGGGGGGTAAATSTSTSGGGTSTTTKPAGGGGASEQGKLIFTQSCGTCHTLKDAGTSGQVGPVLDQVKPDKKRVLAALKNGGLGSGTMPANLVTGKDAEAVAEYVSSVAGK
jgi:mono/diheme cytochrome c family protein